MANQGTFTTNTTELTDLEGGSPYVSLGASGTWGGATVKLQAGFWTGAGPVPVMTWVDVNDSSLTANGCISLAVKADALRVSCSGGTGHSLAWALR